MEPGLATTGTWFAGLALVLASCSAPPLPADDSPSVASPPIAGSASPATLATDSPEPPLRAASPTSCAGRTWPPYRLGEVVGLAVDSTHRATIEITNRATLTYYYRVAGWEPAQFETCRALAEVEAQRGPIAPGATERVAIDPNWWQSGVPVTVAFWDEPCGEGCQREPFAATQVELSPVEPIATDLPHP